MYILSQPAICTDLSGSSASWLNTMVLSVHHVYAVCCMPASALGPSLGHNKWVTSVATLSTVFCYM